MSNYRDEIAVEIIAQMEAGTAPWMKPWQAGVLGAAPFNPVTNKTYRGINDLWLSMRGRGDPRWMTYKQAAEQGAQVRKGEKSTTIEYWLWSERVAVKDGNGKPVLDAEGQQQYETHRLDRPKVFFAKVFNAEQIDGLEPFIAPAPSFNPIERAEAIIASAGVPVFHDQNDRAFYTVQRDEIHLPAQAAFDGPAPYYATLLHELGHATRHPSRLNRENGPFGSELYAREELRAEIASFMLARDMGIGHEPGQHAAYVESWLKALKEDKNEIFRAARDAETIKTWVMEPERRPELERSAGQVVPAPARDLRVARLEDGWAIYDAANNDRMVHSGMDTRHGAEHFAALYRENFDKAREIAQVVNEYHGLAYQAKAAWIDEATRKEVIELRDRAAAIVVERGPDYVKAALSDGINEAILQQHYKSAIPEELKYDIARWEKAGSPDERREAELDITMGVADLTPERRAQVLPMVEKYGITPKDVNNYMEFAEKQLAEDRLTDRAISDYLSKQDELAEELAFKQADRFEQAKERAMLKTYIAVPYAERHEAKAAGAKWDRADKSWYIPEGVDPAGFSKWAGKSEPKAELPPQDEFAQALKDHGLNVEGSPVMDGQWHRCPVKGDKGKERNGAYRGFLNGIPAGNITNYKAGTSEKWVATGVTLTPEERAHIQAEAANVRAQREAELLKAHQNAARKAYGVWQNLPGEATPENSPYLAAKGVQGHGVKVNADGHMVIPCRDSSGLLWNIQTVTPEAKLFLKDSRKEGTFHVLEVTGKGTLDTLLPLKHGTIIIAEGYATAATIFEESGRPVISAFDSGNLKAVAEAVRAKFPDRPLLIAADNDHANVHGNVGMTKAEEAAQAVGGKVVAPNFTAEEKAQKLTDFNDLKQARGAGWVRRTIEGALEQAQGQERGIA